MKCPYVHCSCTAKTCKGKRQGKPQKPWGKYCCTGCGVKARNTAFYARQTKAGNR